MPPDPVSYVHFTLPLFRLRAYTMPFHDDTYTNLSVTVGVEVTPAPRGRSHFTAKVLTLAGVISVSWEVAR